MRNKRTAEGAGEEREGCAQETQRYLVTIL